VEGGIGRGIDRVEEELRILRLNKDHWLVDFVSDGQSKRDSLAIPDDILDKVKMYREPSILLRSQFERTIETIPHPELLPGL